MNNEELNAALIKIWDSLTEEQKDKAVKCKTSGEVLEFAGAEGIELPDEVMKAVSGGYLFNEQGSGGIDVIDDKTYEVLEKITFNNSAVDHWEAARQAADRHGVSRERIIGWDELNRRRDEYERNKKKGGCG